MVENAQNSDIAKAQTDSDTNVLTSVPFANDSAKQSMLLALGADTTPTGISIYPTSAESKDSIKAYLDAYNEGKADEDQVIYSDLAETISTTMSIAGIASLNPLYALILVAGSMLLTLIAGFFPSRIAAKKDPVEALRTE